MEGWTLHIPDGLMAPQVWAAAWVIALPVVAWAISRVNRTIDERVIPFMAMLGAGIFMAQMLNFPIGGGTSGHLIGAALAAMLLGPWGAMVIIVVILMVQSLVFGDGGITALGLNILNMAVIGSGVSWAVLRVFPEKNQRIAVPLAAWASVFCAAMACGMELALSYSLAPGQYGIAGSVAIPTMLASHALIGIGEAVITGGVVIYLAKVAPGLLRMRLGNGNGHEKKSADDRPAGLPLTAKSYAKAALGVVIIFAIGLVGFFIFSASYPDGLERIIEGQGLGEPVYNSPLDYGSGYSTMLFMGIVGSVLILGVILAYLKLADRKRARAENQRE